jgi:4-aminobutyrate aminotransferase/(S)-3-amino-2-methylpropionate transaminase
LSCAAALAVLDEVASPSFRDRAREVGDLLRARLDGIAASDPHIGEVRGLGPMLALELVEDRETRAPATALATATLRGAFDRGLILLACGLHGNVIRVLVPILAPDKDLERGLDILEESLGEAGRTG